MIIIIINIIITIYSIHIMQWNKTKEHKNTWNEKGQQGNRVHYIIVLIGTVWHTNCKIQNIKIKTSNIKPTKCNLVYQAIPKKLVKVDKLQSTFKGAEGTKIYSDDDDVYRVSVVRACLDRKTYVLNFFGRVLQASVKNFQLIDSSKFFHINDEHFILLFTFAFIRSYNLGLGRLSLLPSVRRYNEYQLSGWVIIINGDGGCRLWQPVLADSQPKSSGLVLGRRPLGAVLHSSNEPGELSQWLCHDDSPINIVLYIILLLLLLFVRLRWRTELFWEHALWKIKPKNS